MRSPVPRYRLVHCAVFLALVFDASCAPASCITIADLTGSAGYALVEAPLGCSIGLELSSSIGNGLRWRVRSFDKARLAFVSTQDINPGGDTRLGGRQKQLIRFKPIKLGSSEISLVYVRFGQEVVASRRIRVEVVRSKNEV